MGPQTQPRTHCCRCGSKFAVVLGEVRNQAAGALSVAPSTPAWVISMWYGEPSHRGRDLGAKTEYGSATVSSSSPHCQTEHKATEPGHLPHPSQSSPSCHPPTAGSRTKKKLQQGQVKEQIPATLRTGEGCWGRHTQRLMPVTRMEIWGPGSCGLAVASNRRKTKPQTYQQLLPAQPAPTYCSWSLQRHPGLPRLTALRLAAGTQCIWYFRGSLFHGVGALGLRPPGQRGKSHLSKKSSTARNQNVESENKTL